MQMTLLEIVQDILNDMEGTPVNSIGDSEEATMIANTVRTAYRNLIADKYIPEHNGFVTLAALSDSNKPTHFVYPAEVKDLHSVFYNISLTGGLEWQKITFLEPLDFITRLPSPGTETLRVDDENFSFYIFNNKMPQYYTSFDDNHIVMDSYLATVDSTLQASKAKAYGQSYPSFELSDSFVPVIDNNLFPLLVAESKSMCLSLYKSALDPKVEQSARRLKSGRLNEMFKTRRENVRPKYGRS